MRSRPCSLPRLILLLALTPVASATTWYVNGVGGNDSNNCLSATSACKTIGHAISLAASGDTIKIAAATYFEHLTINISVKLLGASASTSIIDGSGRTGTVVTTSSGTHVTLSGVTITHGYAVSGGGYAASGGGISNYGTLLLTRSAVTGNRAGNSCGRNHGCVSYGGGISNAGTLTISNSTIAGNFVGTNCPKYCYPGAQGGGIYGGTVTISNSTIAGNGASTSCGLPCHPIVLGGGIYRATVTISNSTIAGNFAAESCGLPSCYPPAEGGGIYGVTATISNSTISGNAANLVGGISAAATLQNSIVANNSHGNCAAAVTSKGYNLSNDATCNFTGPGDMNSINPMLGPLQANGGPTQTMALLPGSPAIDAGNPSGCTDGSGHLLKTDQRGKPRPDAEDTGGCDIGAYESQSD